MGYTNPIGVSDWKNQLETSISDDLLTSLPSIEDIEKELKDGEEK